MLARFRPQQQQQRAKSVSVDHTGSSAFVPVADRLRLATAAAAEERRRLFQTHAQRRRWKDHGEPERISESRGSSFQVSYQHRGWEKICPALPESCLGLAKLGDDPCTANNFIHRLLKDEDSAATNAKDVNDADDEDFGECEEVFHDPLCEEEVSIITFHSSFAVLTSDPYVYAPGCRRVADRALPALLPQEDRREQRRQRR